MLVWGLLLSLVGAMLPTAVLAQSPSAIGAPIRYTGHVTEPTQRLFDAGGFVETIQSGAAAKLRETEGWRCVQPFWDPQATQAGRKVEIGVGVAALGTDFVLDLEVRFHTGSRTLSRSRTETVVMTAPLSVQNTPALASYYVDWFGQMVDEMSANGVKPCQVKAKQKGKSKQTAGAGVARVENTFGWDGAGDLEIREDGVLEGTILAQVEASVTGAPCTIEGSSEQPLTVRGRYDDETGTLRLTDLRFGTSASAPFPGVPVDPGGVTMISGRCAMGGATGVVAARPVIGPSIVLAEGFTSEVAVDLSDGATADVPQPPTAFGEWEASIELEYNRDASDMPSDSPEMVSSLPSQL